MRRDLLHGAAQIEVHLGESVRLILNILWRMKGRRRVFGPMGGFLGNERMALYFDTSASLRDQR